MFGRHTSDPTWSAPLDAIAAAEGGSLVDGVPERWLESPTWRCPAAHVSTRLAQGRRARCVFCGSDVVPTFPGDRSGPLPVRNEWLDATRAGIGETVPAQSRHAAADEDADDGHQSTTFSTKMGLRKPR